MTRRYVLAATLIWSGLALAVRAAVAEHRAERVAHAEFVRTYNAARFASQPPLPEEF